MLKTGGGQIGSAKADFVGCSDSGNSRKYSLSRRQKEKIMIMKVSGGADAPAQRSITQIMDGYKKITDNYRLIYSRRLKG
ncbi:hypothetical protein K8T06_08055 [bacterium]|nr:hypothetical protein [bacterium]